MALVYTKGTEVLSVTELGRKIGDLKNIVKSCELNLPLCVLKIRKTEVDFFIVSYVLSHSRFFRRMI